MTKHLILGGCGFIGRHVALLLASEGHEVVLADRRPPDFAFARDMAELVSWKPLEMASADWDTLIEHVDVVHHYAWTSIPASANANPAGDLTSNVTATLDLLEALKRRGEGRLIFSSSGGTVYGKLHTIPVSEDHPMAPITAYGAGKATAELYMGLYRALHGLDTRIARIANPFGVGQNLRRGQGAATIFLHHAVNREPITIWGDGEVVRDYVYITDLARAMVNLALAPSLKQCTTFNIGSGQGVSLNEIVSVLEKLLRRPVDVIRAPGRLFDVPVSILEVSRAREQLGWAPQISFYEGLERTLADLEKNAAMASF